MINPDEYQVELNTVLPSRPAFTAIVFEFTHEVNSDTIRNQAPAINAFNGYPIWWPSVSQIRNVLQNGEPHTKWVAGWADDPGSTDPTNDRPIQNAPTDPTHPAWQGIYTALDNQIGVREWYQVTETLRELRDSLPQQILDNLVRQHGPEVRTDMAPEITDVTILNPP